MQITRNNKIFQDTKSWDIRRNYSTGEYVIMFMDVKNTVYKIRFTAEEFAQMLDATCDDYTLTK